MLKAIHFVYLLLVITFTACKSNVKFASTLPKPEEVVCVGETPAANFPSLVQRGQSFSMSFEADSVRWIIRQGITEITLSGSPVETSLNSNGIYDVSVSGTNNCGDLVEQTFAITVIEPVSGLSIVINNNDVYTRDQNVSLALSAVAASEMYVTNVSNCTSGGSWESYSQDKSWSLGSGNQLNRVYVKYRNAVLETPCVSDDITHDNIAPQTMFVSVPSGTINQSSVTIQMNATDNLSGVKTIFCKLDNDPYRACSTTEQLTGLADGLHSFSMYAEDNAGNISVVDGRSWTQDSSLPTVRITSAPQNPTDETLATFTFVGEDNGQPLNNFRCALDNAPFSVCSSGVRYTNLSYAIHTFRVKAIDAAGNESAEAVHTWEVQDDTVTDIIPITDSLAKPDVLFVVDNSESMYNELRGPIPNRFEDFISDLGSIDYQIAVTTTDARGSRPFEAGGFADVLIDPVPGAGIALVPRQKVITPNMPFASRNFIATIMRPEAICTEVGTHLCPNEGSLYEEAIRSTLLSIDRADTQFFFRNGSDLHIVVVSDTDEGGGSLTYSNGQPIQNIPDYNKPQTLVNRLRAKWPEKNIKIHTVIRRPNDRSCADPQALKGHLVNTLTTMTGGASASICNRYSSDKTQIKGISDAIKASEMSHQLRCVPKDTDGDGQPNVDVSYDPNPGYNVNVSVVGSTIRFSPQPPVGTNVTVRYVCP